MDSKAGSWLSAIPERKALKKDDDHSVVDASANTIHTAAGFYVVSSATRVTSSTFSLARASDRCL